MPGNLPTKQCCFALDPQRCVSFNCRTRGVCCATQNTSISSRGYKGGVARGLVLFQNAFNFYVVLEVW